MPEKREVSIQEEWCKCGRTRLVRIISTIHDATIVNKGRKDRKTNMEIKKPYAVIQYNKFIKSVDRADQYLIYYSVLKKTVKWSKKKDGTISAKLCALERIFCVQDTKYKVSTRTSARGRKVLDIRSQESK